MTTQRTNIPALVCLVALASFVFGTPSVAGTIEDFSGPPAGAVVAGQLPEGGVSPGFSYANLVLSVINYGGGPNALIIFDSENPTGGDPDLGAPNADFGGPGTGHGGESGEQGENNRVLGNLLIVGENVEDEDEDGLVDEPDDEAGGGMIIMGFAEEMTVQRVVLIDIDHDEAASVSAYGEAGLLGTVDGQALGSNSLQTLDLSAFENVLRIEVFLSSSGALAEIEYQRSSVPVETTSWGAIKDLYR